MGCGKDCAVHPETGCGADKAGAPDVHLLYCRGKVVYRSQVFDHKPVRQMPLVNDADDFGVVCVRPDGSVVCSVDFHKKLQEEF